MSEKNLFYLEWIKKYADDTQKEFNKLSAELLECKRQQSVALLPYEIINYDYQNEKPETIEECQNLITKLTNEFNRNLGLVQKNQEIYKSNLEVADHLVRLIKSAGFPYKYTEYNSRKGRRESKDVDFGAILRVEKPLEEYSLKSTFESRIRDLQEKIRKIQETQRDQEKKEKAERYLIEKGRIYATYEVPPHIRKSNDRWTLRNWLNNNSARHETDLLSSLEI